MEQITTDYKSWLTELKNKIHSVQIKTAVAVNSALIEFYWELGKMICEKEAAWGSKLIEQVANDLKAEFPDMKGLSTSNLKYCRGFFNFYGDSIGQQAVDQLQISPHTIDEFVQKTVRQIPWGHNILIFTKSNDIKEARFYIEQTIENNWSRDVLALQLKSNLYTRAG